MKSKIIHIICSPHGGIATYVLGVIQARSNKNESIYLFSNNEKSDLSFKKEVNKFLKNKTLTFQGNLNTHKKPILKTEAPPAPLNVDQLLKAFEVVMKRAKLYSQHKVVQETLSVREPMVLVLDRLSSQSFVEFTQLFDVTEGRVGVVVSLIAILELVRQKVLSFVQTDRFGSIHIKATSITSE